MKSVNFKKKPGRPRKVVNNDFVLMKSDTEIKLEKAEAFISLKNEDIADLLIKLDNAYKEQEAMLKKLDECIYDTIHHCSKIEMSTGEITLHDVDYCVDIIRRTLHNKFGNKPTEE